MKHLLLFLMLLISSLASAINFEMALGMTQFNKKENGFWYQEGFPYKLKMDSPTISLGIEDSLYKNIHYRIGYTYLGQVKSESLATSSDDNYNSNNPPLYCNGPCWNLATWKGKGDVQGFYFSLPIHFNISNIELILENGLFVYRPSWNVKVYGWQACYECELQDIEVSHGNTWKIGNTYGIGIKKDKYTIMFEQHSTESGEPFPAVYGSKAYSLTLRRAF